MTDSTIDMDRAMQGIDDADSHIKNLKWEDFIQLPIDFTGTRIRVTDRNNKIYVHDGYTWKPEITWTNCADAMPQDDRNQSIIRTPDGIFKTMNRDLWNEKHLYATWNELWTPYTPEKWEYLNK